jgi:UDP-galactopyranose mutase
MTKVLVVGGGPAGCIATHFLTLGGYDVTLVESSNVLGGASRTHYYGGHPYHFGPRHFLTKQERVWSYFNKYCPMKRYKGHEFLTYVERDWDGPRNGFYHFPIHRDEVDEMPDAELIRKELAEVPGAAGARNLEEYWLFSVGPTLTEKFVSNYSQKMWPDAKNTDITDFGFTPKGVPIKTGPIKAAWSEVMSGFPLSRNAYDDYWPVATADATVRLNTKIQCYDFRRREVLINGEWEGPWDIFVSTISPEDVFNACFSDKCGKLRWMGRDFLPVVLYQQQVFPEHVYFQYYAGKEPFTRIVEYKKFFEWDLPSPTTLIGIEIPSKRGKFYPYPMAPDQALAKRYQDLAPDCVHWMGRNGSYRYLDMGNMIEQGFELMEKLA